MNLWPDRLEKLRSGQGARKFLETGQALLRSATPRGVVPWIRSLQGRSADGRVRSSRELANRRLLDRELKAHARVLQSHPVHLVLDPATACNLKCPFCPTGGGYTGIAKELLLPETFSRIVDKLDLELLDSVLLYNWGEPLLNPHLPDYIRVFAEHGKETEISVNLSTRDYDHAFFETLVESGLTRLVASVDGATQETYARYRVGGRLDRVLGNMKTLNEVKQQLGKAQPRVIYRMLLNRYNEPEIEEARRLAGECGAEFLLEDHFWCPDEHREEWIVQPKVEIAAEAAEAAPAVDPTAQPVEGTNAGPVEMPEPVPEQAPKRVFHDESQKEISTFCRQLWDTLIVNANGDVYPCCLIYQPEHSIGNIARQSLDEVRNDEKAVYLRGYVTGEIEAPPDFANHCEGCPSKWCAT